MIENVLEEYNINKANIISIVTENATNMVKTIEKLNESQEAETCATTDKDAMTLTEEDDLDENLDDVAEEASKLCKIRHIRCTVHTLQLSCCRFDRKIKAGCISCKNTQN